MILCCESLRLDEIKLILDTLRLSLSEEERDILLRLRAESTMSRVEAVRLREEWERFDHSCKELWELNRVEEEPNSYPMFGRRMEIISQLGERYKLYLKAKGYEKHVRGLAGQNDIPSGSNTNDVADSLPSAHRKRTADSKQDNRENFPVLLPDSQQVRDLCRKLQKELPGGLSQIAIARESTGETEGNDRKAQSLLRQARRFPHLWKPADK
jgi:hypothetical protein